MAAPKLNHNLSLKKENTASGVQDSSRHKIEIEAYREKIKEMLKNPKNVKKAVQIIEQMLNQKKM